MTATMERPLGLLPEVRLSDRQLEVLCKIEQCEFPYVKERILQKEIIPFDRVDEAIHEFRRFFSLLYLTRGTGKSLGVASEEVDEVWHTFILFTVHYHKFCAETVGEYMHHLPKTSYTPTAPNTNRNLREAYQRYFGEIPTIWVKQEDCSTASSGDDGTDGNGNDD